MNWKHLNAHQLVFSRNQPALRGNIYFDKHDKYNVAAEHNEIIVEILNADRVLEKPFQAASSLPTHIFTK